MENSLKGLLLAAGTIITCIVISLGFFIAREARDTAADGAGQISKLNAEFNESDKVMYDGLTVSGSEVINVINKFRNSNLSVLVENNKVKTPYYYELVSRTSESGEKTWSLGAKTMSDGYAVQNSSSSSYINPNAQFTGDVVRDVNHVIVGIVFQQTE